MRDIRWRSQAHCHGAEQARGIAIRHRDPKDEGRVAPDHYEKETAKLQKR